MKLKQDMLAVYLPLEGAIGGRVEVGNFSWVSSNVSLCMLVQVSHHNGPKFLNKILTLQKKNQGFSPPLTNKDYGHYAIKNFYVVFFEKK